MAYGKKKNVNKLQFSKAWMESWINFDLSIIWDNYFEFKLE